ncbi:Uncharacterized protein FKW44_020807 [Caligus rogercresseyi]|uniref:Uncharacterized protein n=1 Tax=Caligus rogercresseyi TaxID=217165 RepID=A0A7T8GQH5_CALRO|nr:Uncharacterized protein FKW44_020807 [Caligus rogercresseyi]
MPPHSSFGRTRRSTPGLLQVLGICFMVKNTPPETIGQQDGAPSHMAAKNQKFCKDNMAHFWPKNFWPPSSRI